MASITIRNFQAANYGIDKKELQNNQAVEARNCDLSSQALRPASGSISLGESVNTPGVGTIYWFNREGNSGDGYWLEWWNADVDMVRGPIADDPYYRHYWTGNGSPKYATADMIQSGSGPYPSGSRGLGLPVPGNVGATGPDTENAEDGEQVISTAYVVTFVSDLGEEGPPSLPSNIVDRYDSGSVSLTLPLPGPTPAVITTKRIYRAELNGVYQFVGEVGVSQLSWTDSVASAALGEPLPSDGWIEPHFAMIGLTSIPNGVLMGWWDNNIAFCHPYQPHAWPVEYRYTIDHEVVGAAVTAAGVIIATKGNPYLISGSDPLNMSVNKLDSVIPCDSKNSMVDMGEFAVYASPDGLVAVGGMEARIISKDHIKPEFWQSKFNPKSIRGHRWKEGRYLGFYDDGSGISAFTFRPDEGFIVFPGVNLTATWTDPETGDVYGLDGTDIVKWGEGADLFYQWSSKTFVLPPMMPFTCARIDAGAAGVVTCQVYQDGVSVKAHTVNDSKPFRLPCLSKYRELRFVLSGQAQVNSIQLATSMSEIV